MTIHVKRAPRTFTRPKQIVKTPEQDNSLSGFIHVITRDNIICNYDFSINLGDVYYTHSSSNNLKRGKLVRNNVKIARKELNKVQQDFFGSNSIKMIEEELKVDSVYTDIEHLVKSLVSHVFSSTSNEPDGKNIRFTFSN